MILVYLREIKEYILKNIYFCVNYGRCSLITQIGDEKVIIATSNRLYYCFFAIYIRNLKFLMNITLFFAILHFYTSILRCSYVTYIFTKLHRNFCVKSFIRSLFGKKLQCRYIAKFLVQITLKFSFIGYPPGDEKNKIKNI